jgi:hypothetical protein
MSSEKSSRKDFKTASLIKSMRRRRKTSLNVSVKADLTPIVVIGANGHFYKQTTSDKNYDP